MVDTRKRIADYIAHMDREELLFVSNLYEERFSDISEAAFFKMIERMTKEGQLVRIVKGIYAKPGLTKEQIETAVLNFYFGENNDEGMYIGTQLYCKYQLTGEVSERKVLYSNRTRQDKKVIGNVTVLKASVGLTYEHAKVLELLEILDNVKSIPSLSRTALQRYLKNAVRNYQDASACEVIISSHYKKSTIALLKKILDGYGTPNSLGQFLNSASKYRFPRIKV